MQVVLKLQLTLAESQIEEELNQKTNKFNKTLEPADCL